MAKRKLSSEQRQELRSELAASIKSGKSVMETITAAAQKYSLSTVTLRWYLKGLSGGPKRKLGRPKGSKNEKGPKPGAKRGPGRPRGSKNRARSTSPKQLGSLLGKLKVRAQAAAKNANLVKKLLPRWESLLAREAALKSQEQAVRQELKAVAKSSQALGARIQGLVRV